MITHKYIASVVTILMLFGFSEAFPAPGGQHAPGETHTFRTICALGFGALGGIAGVKIAESATTSYGGQAAVGISAMVAGAVGGYFIGRKIDKSRIDSPKPDPQTIKQAQIRAVKTLPVPHFAIAPDKPSGDGEKQDEDAAGLAQPVPEIR